MPFKRASSRWAFNSDDADVVTVAVLKVRLAGGTGKLAAIDDLPDEGSLEGTPFGRGHDLLRFRRGLAVRGQDPLGTGVQRHRHVVRVRYGNPDDGDDAAEVEGGQEVRDVGSVPWRVLGVDDHIVESEGRHGSGPSRVAAHAEHRAVDDSTAVDSFFKLCSVHDSSHQHDSGVPRLVLLSPAVLGFR